MSGYLILKGGLTGDGTIGDVAVDPTSGLIVEVGPDIPPGAEDTVEDCRDTIVLPAPAEPHAHLDKALSADSPLLQAANLEGDLTGAIAAWQDHWPRLTHEDMTGRATVAVEQMVAHGTTAIRTHVDVSGPLSTLAVAALVSVKERVRARRLAEMQLVALVSPPVTGVEGKESRRLLEEALDVGADLVGGCPYRDPDPVGATAFLLDVAEQYGVGVDLHTDETLDPGVLTLRDLAVATSERDMGGRVTASHCVSLGVQKAPVQAEVAAMVAAAGVSVVTLPQTNLYLQARDHVSAPPRALTAIRALLNAGAVVAGGADNVRDPFCSIGRMDATETAALLVMAGHLTVREAWELCSSGARLAMRLPTVTIEPGAPAELVCLEGRSLAGAVAAASEQRLTIHHGAIVARSTVSRAIVPAFRPVQA